MKLFIWEGNGISNAYHDDGTLVVLADTAEQAREIIREGAKKQQEQEDAWIEKRDRLMNEFEGPGGQFWKSPQGKALLNDEKYSSKYFDGKLKALEREPDRIEELDKPKWIAFNGGGYD